MVGKYLPVIKAAHCGSINKAAAELGYTQPSLWHIIKNIEEDLDVKLFFRNRKGVVLTETGSKLIEFMEEIEALEAELVKTASIYAENHIRVGVFSDVANLWMPDIVTDLYQNCSPVPRIKMVYPTNIMAGIRKMESHTLDCCFTTLSDYPKLDSYLLYRDEYWLVVNSTDSLANAESVSIWELLRNGDHTFIPTNESFDPNSPIYAFFKKVSNPFLLYGEPIDNRLALSLVEENLGVAILPGLFLDGLDSGVAVVRIPIKERIARNISLMCQDKDTRSPMASLFLEHCLSYINKKNEAKKI